MRKKTTLSSRLKTGLLALLFALNFSIITPVITTPTFADPVAEAPEDTPEDSPEDPETPPEEGSETGTNPNQYVNNCTNQTDSIGWLICPTTGVIATAIDALLSIINDFLVIDPISFNTDSPLYTVWDYCRSITNIIFILILLVCIFSQVTGLGFSNYNVKKVLPKVIIAAILINLSFILCSLLVDLSNIIGASLQDIFTGLEEQIVAAHNIQVDDFTLTAVTTAILGGTGIAASLGIVAAGGMAAFFWMLVPILLGALVSVVSGLLTISARQAVILLLVMIAPLAVVAYCLPNTEKWFQKWKALLIQMLIFYPTFSFLFGASELLGFTLIASAGENVYLVLLGIAVQIFPLFFSWNLMKMSGTILGTLNQKFNNLGKSALRPVGNYAAERRALSKARHTATSRMPSATINRWLEDNKARRALDTAEYNKRSAARAAANAYNPYNRKGQLTRRGEKLYAMQADTMGDNNRLKQYKAEFEEQGYGDDGSDRRVKKGSLDRMKAANAAIVREVDRGHLADSFLESAKTANAVSYAGRVEERRNQITDIRNQLAEGTITQAQADAQINAVNADLTSALSAVANPEDRTKYMNNVFANAISSQAKADKALRDNYASLFAATQLTRNIHREFNKSFSDKNYNAMEAAIDELAKRGDFDLIRESLLAHSSEIAGEGDVEMQKHLADTLIKYKADSAPLWAYAKATNIRRAKHANKPDEVALFTTFEEFETGAVPAGYDGSIDPNRIEKKKTTDELSMSFLVSTINNPSIAVSQDRTTFKYLLESQKKGNIQVDNLGFALKQLRSAASSGQIDGEQLTNLNKLITGGIVLQNGKPHPLEMKPEDVKFVADHADSIRTNIQNYLEGLSANQLASMKESSFKAFNDALIYLDQIQHRQGATVKDYSIAQDGSYLLSDAFYNAVFQNAGSNMNNIIKSSMNVNVKKWLGIKSNKQY